MATSSVSPKATEVETIRVKRNVFDIEKFERVTLEGDTQYKDATSVEEVTTEIGNDTAKLLKLLNIARRRMAILEAKKQLTSPNAVKSSIVAQFVKTFKMIPPFMSMPTNTPEERKAQKQAIYSMIRSQEMILNGIKAASAAATDEDDEEEDNEE